MVESNEKGEIDRSGENREVSDFFGQDGCTDCPWNPPGTPCDGTTAAVTDVWFKMDAMYSTPKELLEETLFMHADGYENCELRRRA